MPGQQLAAEHNGSGESQNQDVSLVVHNHSPFKARYCAALVAY
jgi:hypothetical protein